MNQLDNLGDIRTNDTNGPTSASPVRDLAQVAHRVAGRQRLIFLQNSDRMALSVLPHAVLVRVEFEAWEHRLVGDKIELPTDGDRAIHEGEKQSLGAALAAFLAVWPDTMAGISIEGLNPLVGARCDEGHFTLVAIYHLPRHGLAPSDDQGDDPSQEVIERSWAGRVTMTPLFPSNP